MQMIGNVHTPIEIHMQDEYNIQELIDMNLTRSVMLGQGGSGKTYTLLMSKVHKFGGDKIIVVVANNAQAKIVMSKYGHMGVKSITYHRWRGESTDGKLNKQAYDMHGIKCVIFDEIMLYTHEKLVKIWLEMEKHPDMEYHATGDAMQLEAINDTIDTKTKLNYITSPKLFPTMVRLMKNKRLKTDADRETMDAIIQDLQYSKSVWHVVKKYFSGKIIPTVEDMREKNIKRAVTYFGNNSDTINAHIHAYYPHDKKAKSRKLQNNITFFQGSDLICKDSWTLADSTCKMHPNYVYRIYEFKHDKGGEEGYFIMQDILNPDMKHIVSHTKICSSFSLPYCNTVHAAQGDAINEQFIIADWQCNKITTNWFYTAISRSERMNDVWFLGHSLKSLNKQQVATNMVHGYRYQDKKEHRAYAPSAYITPEWILDMYKKHKHCPMCQQYMGFEKGNPNKVTVDRIHNNMAHIKANCQLMCKACNRAKK